MTSTMALILVAQLATATFGVWDATVVDTNKEQPVRVYVVPALCGLTNKLAETIKPEQTPTILRWDDVDPKMDCEAQVALTGLSTHSPSGYRGAVSVNGSPFSAASSRFLAPPPAQLPTVIAGQPFTIKASHPCTNATSFNLYIDGAQAGADISASECVGGFVTATVQGVLAGQHSSEMAAVDGMDEHKGPTTLFLAVQPHTVAPGAPTVTQP